MWKRAQLSVENVYETSTWKQLDSSTNACSEQAYDARAWIIKRKTIYNLLHRFMYKNQISWKGTKDVDDAPGALIGKHFSVIHTQISMGYTQYLADSLTIETGNFYIFPFGKEFLENWMKKVVLMMRTLHS